VFSSTKKTAQQEFQTLKKRSFFEQKAFYFRVKNSKNIFYP